MACLAAKLYDPGTAADKATSTLLAMTALDTTNLRNTITGPQNGTVLAKLRLPYTGATTAPAVLLGVMDGAAVKGRQTPVSGGELSQASATDLKALEASFLITGLTAGTSYNLDAAYAVQAVVASSVLRIGGPNNTTAGDAGGGAAFEIYDTKNLLYGTMYDPGTAVTKSLASLLALTAIDTTNLRAQFTTPGSGLGSSFVLVRSVMPASFANAAATAPSVMGGIMNHSGGAVVARQIMARYRNSNAGGAATDRAGFQMEMVVAVTPNTAFDWDLAYGVEKITASCDIHYGGPNDATGADAWGGISFEVWAV